MISAKNFYSKILNTNNNKVYLCNCNIILGYYLEIQQQLLPANARPSSPQGIIACSAARHLHFGRLHSVCMARGFDYVRLAKEMLKRDGNSISMNNGNTERCLPQYHYTTEIANLCVASQLYRRIGLVKFSAYS